MSNIIKLPPSIVKLGLDASFYGILISLIVYIPISLFTPDPKRP